MASPDTVDPDVTPEVVANHYRRAAPALRILGAYGNKRGNENTAPQTVPIHDHYGWYRRRNPEDPDTDAVVEKRCWQFLDEFDTWIDRIDRSLYTILNYQSPESLRWVGRKDLDGDDYQWLDEQGSPTPPYRDIEAMAIFADVDLEDEAKTRPLDNETQEVFEQALEYYVEALCDLTGSDPETCEHVKLLDSVGGAYPFVPPAATAPIADEFGGEERAWIFEELGKRVKAWLARVTNEIHDEIAGAREVVDTDHIVHVNRQWKTLLAAHKSIDGVVHPLDPTDIRYDFLPIRAVTDDHIDEAKAWAEDFTDESHSRAIESVIATLWSEYYERDGVETWTEALDEWVEDERAGTAAVTETVGPTPTKQNGETKHRRQRRTTEVAESAPDTMPPCYAAALRARGSGAPEEMCEQLGGEVNHAINRIAAILGVHAGYSTDSIAEHMCDVPEFTPEGGKRGLTRQAVAGTRDKAERGELEPPYPGTLFKYRLIGDPECAADCPIHGDPSEERHETHYIEVEPGAKPGDEEREAVVEDDPLAHDVTLEPATAWRAAGAVTPDDLEPDDEHGRDLDIEESDDGTVWACPCCGNDIDVVRAVAIQEGLVDRCDDRLDDRLYDEAYQRARRTYGAPLPEYVTEETATERWDVIQGALEQLTHYHLDSIDSEITGQGDGHDVVAEIDPSWEDSNSGKRVIAFRDGPFYCREHECVIDPVRFVALEEGIIDECSADLGGELFREAYVATRERGAPLPRWTVGNPDHHPVLPPADELVGEFATDVDALDNAREEVEDLYRQAATDASAAHLLRALPSLGKTTSTVKTAVDEPTLYLGPRKELQKEVEQKAKEYGVSWMHLPVLSEHSPDDEVVGKAVRLVREEGKDLLRDYDDLFDRATPDEDEEDEESDENESRDDGQQDPTDAVPSLEDAHNAGHGSLSGARLNAADTLAGARDTDEDDEEIHLDRASCPTANGVNGEALQLAIHVARELGHSPRDIHVADKQLFGAELDCQHEGECPYSVAWSAATDPDEPIDLLIGSYGHAHVGGARTHYSTNEFESTVLEPRTVVFDEFPGEAFAESFGSEALDHATWLASELVFQVDDRQDMIEQDLWANDWVRAWLRGQGENTVTGQLHLTRLRYADACRRVLDTGEESQHDTDGLLADLDRKSPGTWTPDELGECLNACPTAPVDTPVDELKGALTDAIGALAELTPLVATNALLSAAGLTTSHNESNGDVEGEDEDGALGALVDRAIEACFEDSEDGGGD